MQGNQMQKSKLGAPVSFSERMDRIQFSEKISGGSHELIGVASGGKRSCVELLEFLLHLSGDVFRIAEPVSVFAGPNGAIATGPAIDVLKEVVVDPTIMCRTKLS